MVGTVTNEAEPDSAKEETMTSEHVQRLAEWLKNGNFYVPETDEQITSFAQEALDASGATARIDELEGDVKFQIENLRGWIDLNADLWRALKAEKRVKELEERWEFAVPLPAEFKRVVVEYVDGRKVVVTPEEPGAALSPAQQSDE